MQSSAGPPPIKLVNSPKLLMPLRHQWCPMSPDACPCTHITTLLFVLVSVSTGLASLLWHGPGLIALAWAWPHRFGMGLASLLWHG